MEKKYRVDGMGCMKCAAKIENRLRELDGIRSASVDFASKTLTLAGDFRDDAVVAAVADVGDYELTHLGAS